MSLKKFAIKHDDVLENFLYLPCGRLQWLTAGSGRTKGDIAGCVTKNNYRQITFKQVTLKEHQLIWFYHYGSWAKYIDHIFGDTHDNRIENIRECTLSQNQHNRRMSKNNATGLACVRKMPSGRYEASICFESYRKTLGSFIDEAEAFMFREAAEIELFGSFMNSEKYL